MQIVIIGTGNTATVLSAKLKSSGHAIVQVYGRNQQAAALLAANLGAPFCSEWSDITKEAELYIIAISDTALQNQQLPLRLDNRLVVHTAGSVPMDALATISSRHGVFYPLQTIRKEMLPVTEIPLLVDANTAQDKQLLVELAKSMSDKVSMAGDAERMRYHLCAVMTNNFSNYLYTLAEDYCSKNSMDFGNLLPLIDETAARLHQFSPAVVQTGPAVRKDTGTIQRHLQLLADEPALGHLYKVISDGIMQYPWKDKRPA